MRPFKWASIGYPRNYFTFDDYDPYGFSVVISDVENPEHHNAACLYNAEKYEEIRERIAKHCPAVKDATVIDNRGFRSAKECIDFCEERNLTIL